MSAWLSGPRLLESSVDTIMPRLDVHAYSKTCSGNHLLCMTAFAGTDHFTQILHCRKRAICTGLPAAALLASKPVEATTFTAASRKLIHTLHTKHLQSARNFEFSETASMSASHFVDYESRKCDADIFTILHNTACAPLFFFLGAGA